MSTISVDGSSDHGANRFSVLFEGIPLGCYMLDLEGRITKINERGASMLGCTADQAVGTFIWDFVRKGQADKYQAQVLAKSKRRTVVGESKLVTLIRRDNSFPLPVSIKDIVLIQEGRSEGLLSIVEDFSVSSQIESDLSISD